MPNTKYKDTQEPGTDDANTARKRLIWFGIHLSGYFLVMLVLPVSVAGGVAALRIVGLFGFQALDLLTMIGFIILLGLVVNAAILLVDQTRARERSGVPRREAVRQALETRARPIVLSTLTAVLGMLPLIAMPGLGAEIYRGLASVVAGGMLLGTLFTWFLMPALLRAGETEQSRSLAGGFAEAKQRS